MGRRSRATYMRSPAAQAGPASLRGFCAATRSPRAPASRLAGGRRTWLSLASEVPPPPIPTPRQHSILAGPQALHPGRPSTQAHTPDSRSCTRGLGSRDKKLPIRVCPVSGTQGPLTDTHTGTPQTGSALDPPPWKAGRA